MKRMKDMERAIEERQAQQRQAQKELVGILERIEGVQQRMRRLQDSVNCLMSKGNSQSNSAIRAAVEVHSNEATEKWLGNLEQLLQCQVRALEQLTGHLQQLEQEQQTAMKPSPSPASGRKRRWHSKNLFLHLIRHANSHVDRHTRSRMLKNR